MWEIIKLFLKKMNLCDLLAMGHICKLSKITLEFFLRGELGQEQILGGQPHTLVPTCLFYHKCQLVSIHGIFSIL